MAGRRRPTRPPEVSVDEHARQTFIGGLGGALESPRPISPDYFPETNFLGGGSAAILFKTDEFTLTSASQTITLTYIPMDHSEHVYLHHTGVGGVYKEEVVQGWTRAEGTKTISITAPLGAQAGDVVVVSYAYYANQPNEACDRTIYGMSPNPWAPEWTDPGTGEIWHQGAGSDAFMPQLIQVGDRAICLQPEPADPAQHEWFWYESGPDPGVTPATWVIALYEVHGTNPPTLSGRVELGAFGRRTYPPVGEWLMSPDAMGGFHILTCADGNLLLEASSYGPSTDGVYNRRIRDYWLLNPSNFSVIDTAQVNIQDLETQFGASNKPVFFPSYNLMTEANSRGHTIIGLNITVPDSASYCIMSVGSTAGSIEINYTSGMFVNGTNVGYPATPVTIYGDSQFPSGKTDNYYDVYGLVSGVGCLWAYGEDDAWIRIDVGTDGIPLANAYAPWVPDMTTTTPLQGVTGADVISFEVGRNEHEPGGLITTYDSNGVPVVYGYISAYAANSGIDIPAWPGTASPASPTSSATWDDIPVVGKIEHNTGNPARISFSEVLPLRQPAEDNVPWDDPDAEFQYLDRYEGHWGQYFMVYISSWPVRLVNADGRVWVAGPRQQDLAPPYNAYTYASAVSAFGDADLKVIQCYFDDGPNPAYDFGFYELPIISRSIAGLDMSLDQNWPSAYGEPIVHSLAAGDPTGSIHVSMEYYASGTAVFVDGVWVLSTWFEYYQIPYDDLAGNHVDMHPILYTYPECPR